MTLVAPSAGAVEVVATIDDHTATAPGPNGHQYRYYPTHVTWTAARAAASALSLYGKTGYLVTVMSVEEETYLETLIGSESVSVSR